MRFVRELTVLKAPHHRIEGNLHCLRTPPLTNGVLSIFCCPAGPSRSTAPYRNSSENFKFHCGGQGELGHRRVEYLHEINCVCVQPCAVFILVGGWEHLEMLAYVLCFEAALELQNWQLARIARPWLARVVVLRQETWAFYQHSCGAVRVAANQGRREKHKRERRRVILELQYPPQYPPPRPLCNFATGAVDLSTQQAQCSDLGVASSARRFTGLSRCNLGPRFPVF